jgi:hypothetical protein
LSGEAQEIHSQEEHHSAEDLHDSEREQAEEPSTADSDLGSQGSQPESNKLERIKWPALNERQWKEFDEDVDCILEQVSAGTAERKLKSMTALIYVVGKERFGVISSGGEQVAIVKKNRRQLALEKLRKDLRNLRNLYGRASEVERISLQALRDQLRCKLQELRIRKARREKAKQRSRFLSNPYGFSKNILEEKRPWQLSCSREEVEEHLKQTHSDQSRHVEMESHKRIAPVPMPEVAFTEGEPTLKEVQEIIKKARSKSAPGPNGIPYKVYKSCPKLLRRLWKLLKVVWLKGDVPAKWQRAEGIFVPKEEDSKNIGQFRVCRHIHPERRCSRILWLHQTHKCYQPADRGSKDQQNRSHSSVVGSSECVWDSVAQAH